MGKESEEAGREVSGASGIGPVALAVFLALAVLYLALLTRGTFAQRAPDGLVAFAALPNGGGNEPQLRHLAHEGRAGAEVREEHRAVPHDLRHRPHAHGNEERDGWPLRSGKDCVYSPT